MKASILDYPPKRKNRPADDSSNPRGSRLEREIERLTAERDVYRRYFQGELFAAFMTRDTGEVIDCNQSCIDLLGYSSLEEIKRAGAKSFYLRDEHREALMERLRRDETIFRHRIQLKRRDGSPVDVIAYSQGHRRADGSGLDITGFLFRDSDERRAQDRLLERSGLLAHSVEAVLICDPAQRVKSWNTRAQELFRFSAQDAKGADWSRLIGPVEELDPQEAWEELLRSGSWSGEFRLASPEGTPRIVGFRCQLLADSKGKPRSVLMMGSDLTETRAIEANLYRTQRLETLGTLAGGIAHDLNNVLTPILLSASLLRTSTTNEEDRGLLDSMVATARRGKEMVQQILWFARGTPGSRSAFRPNTILQELARVLEHTLPRSIELEVDLGTDLPPILGDPTQIFQALMNLCLNARDAMPAGGNLRVMARGGCGAPGEPSGPSGACLLLEISDTGDGIAEGHLEKIFDPFFTTKDPGEGTGLGLTTARSIVKSHGGTIELLSEPGRGTVFRLVLPALDEGAPVEDRPAQRLPSARGEQRTLLVADDDPEVLELTARTLESSGYRVLRARDGAEALELFAEGFEGISGVLCDQDMPGLDGLETLRAMSRIAPETPMFLTSGLPGFTPALDRFGVLSKPWSPGELLRAVEKLLAEGPGGAESETAAGADPNEPA